MISCIRNILEIALSNPIAGKTFFYNPANYMSDIALDYGGFPLEASIKNRNFRANNRVINQGPQGKRAYNQNFNQPEVWNQNPQSYFVDDWSQASNSMANSNCPIGQQPQLSPLNNYQQPTNFNQQSGYQQQPYPQQNPYLDPTGFPSGTNSQLYGSNDLVGGQLGQLNNAGSLGALNSNQIKTFWNNYYSGDHPNNLTVPINVDGRVNMT